MTAGIEGDSPQNNGPSELSDSDFALRKLKLEIRKLESEISESQKKKLDFEIKKLVADTNFLGQFSTKVWPIVATFITLFLSAFALYTSFKTQDQQAFSLQQQKHQDSVVEALKLATDGSGEIDRRIAGIWQLKQAWQTPDDFEVTASVLSAELTLPDKDRFARCAAAEVIGSAMQVGGQNQAKLARLLFGNKSGEIGLVIQQHGFLLNSKASRPASNNCVTALDATREAIRKNWRYLRDVNLNGTDLSKIQMYAADLDGALLRGSILRDANFRCANLNSSDLSDADWQTTDFTFANVHQAQPESFRAAAIARGAIDMTAKDWHIWKDLGFRIDHGKPVLHASNAIPADCLHSATYPFTVSGGRGPR